MKRKRAAHHANHERWLVSYADLLTLLFAFFVVMYAVGHSDTAQVHQLTQAIMAAFSELGLFTPSQMQNQLRPLMSVGYQARQDRDDQAALASLREHMQTAMAPQIHNHQVSMDLTHQGLVIRVEETGFFDSGSDQMRPESAEMLQRIAESLRPLPNEIRVEGHTDNVPIHTPRFSSNWQLSSARAAAIAEILVSQYQIQPARISAAGYAEYRPIADNDTEAGRQQNRRVDIVVLSLTKSVADGIGGTPPDTPPAAGSGENPVPASVTPGAPTGAAPATTAPAVAAPTTGAASPTVTAPQAAKPPPAGGRR